MFFSLPDNLEIMKTSPGSWIQLAHRPGQLELRVAHGEMRPLPALDRHPEHHDPLAADHDHVLLGQRLEADVHLLVPPAVDLVEPGLARRLLLAVAGQHSARALHHPFIGQQLE